jgi:hypothetical protein
MKMKPEEITAMLNKAIESAVGHSQPETGDTRVIALEKAVASMSAQFSKMVELASTGFEKPKSMEDIVADLGKTLDSKITTAIAKATGKDTDVEPIPQTKGDLRKMLEEVVVSVLEKSAKDKGKPKGQGKDALEKAIDNLDDADVQTVTDEALAEIETETTLGKQLTKEQRSARLHLDETIGNILDAQRSKVVGDKEDDE